MIRRFLNWIRRPPWWSHFDVESDELNDESLEMIRSKARLFLLGGGVVSMGQWEKMGSAGRSAFVSASSEIWMDRILSASYASHGLDEWLEIYSETDGGQLKTERALFDAASKVAERHAAGKPIPVGRRR